MLDLLMNTSAIIQAIDDQIAQLQSARALLVGSSQSAPTEARKPGRPKGVKNTPAAEKTTASNAGPKKRVMSAEGKARIAAAQKARWAKQHAANGASARKTVAIMAAKSPAKKAPVTKAASEE